jgi:hypothetical protein
MWNPYRHGMQTPCELELGSQDADTSTGRERELRLASASIQVLVAVNNARMQVACKRTGLLTCAGHEWTEAPAQQMRWWPLQPHVNIHGTAQPARQLHAVE